jgi:hypothetical protein
MILKKVLNISCLYCPVQYLQEGIFFSLIDYRNNYFTSDDPNKIIEFYSGFENREQLLQWMRERPKGVAKIHEIDGDKDIIVVIPTSDFNGKFAKECRENIFKGLYIVFVESGGRGDFYFNFAHNVNVGIKKAMEYNPKWIIVSNDDMCKIDVVSILIEKLKMLDNRNINVVFTKPSNYHSHIVRLAKPNLLFYLYLYISNKNFSIKLLGVTRTNDLKVTYDQVPYDSKISYLFKKGYRFINYESFGIFSSNYIKSFNCELLDETFINAGEDVDLSLKLSLNPEKTATIDYKIGNYIGGTLGNGTQRALRTHAGRIYLNYKWDKIIDDLLVNKD